LERGLLVFDFPDLTVVVPVVPVVGAGGRTGVMSAEAFAAAVQEAQAQANAPQAVTDEEMVRGHRRRHHFIMVIIIIFFIFIIIMHGHYCRPPLLEIASPSP
jgi:pheromone shutdown protein TraB